MGLLCTIVVRWSFFEDRVGFSYVHQLAWLIDGVGSNNCRELRKAVDDQKAEKAVDHENELISDEGQRSSDISFVVPSLEAAPRRWRKR